MHRLFQWENAQEQPKVRRPLKTNAQCCTETQRFAQVQILNIFGLNAQFCRSLILNLLQKTRY